MHPAAILVGSFTRKMERIVAFQAHSVIPPLRRFAVQAANQQMALCA
jgi:hypothetical protein